MLKNDVVRDMLVVVLDEFINNMNHPEYSTRDCYWIAIRDIRKVFER